MATSVTIQVGGSARVCDYEVSAGAEGTLSGRESKTVEIGTQGSSISFLTVKRVGPGTISLKASGKCSISVDGAKDKKTKSLSLSPKNNRAVVREAVK